MKDCRKLTTGDWLGILTIVISFFGYFYYINHDSQSRIIGEIDSLKIDVRAVDAKIGAHVQYHLDNKGNGRVNCQSIEREVSYAEVAIETSKATREEDTQSTRQ